MISPVRPYGTGKGGAAYALAIPFGGIGIWELLFLFLIVLLFFGAKRLPEIGSSLGKGIREFKDSLRELGNEEKREIPGPPEGNREGEPPADEGRRPGG